MSLIIGLPTGSKLPSGGIHQALGRARKVDYMEQGGFQLWESHSLKWVVELVTTFDKV